MPYIYICHDKSSPTAARTRPGPAINHYDMIMSSSSSATRATRYTYSVRLWENQDEGVSEAGPAPLTAHLSFAELALGLALLSSGVALATSGATSQ